MIHHAFIKCMSINSQSCIITRSSFNEALWLETALNKKASLTFHQDLQQNQAPPSSRKQPELQQVRHTEKSDMFKSESTSPLTEASPAKSYCRPSIPRANCASVWATFYTVAASDVALNSGHGSVCVETLAVPETRK